MPTLADFERDYWAPDREEVLAQMRAEAQAPASGQAQGGYQPFNEQALSQAWLSSGGRTQGDLANFFAQHPELTQGATLVGSKKDKIRLPDGRVVDAVYASGLGGQGAQWNLEDGGGGGQSGGSSYGRAPNSTPFSYEKFVAPTLEQAMAEPGYQARMQQGTDALQKSAAARGTLLTGGTMKDLNQYAQDYASNEYANTYGRALDAYKTNFETAFKPWEANYNQAYQSWLGNYNAANSEFQNNLAAQGQRYNQLYGAANLGLQATNQYGGYQQNAANNAGNIATGYGNNQSELTTGQGNAQAAGQVGSGNAWSQGWGGVGNAANMAAIYSMYGQQSNKGRTDDNAWKKYYGIE